MNLNIKENKIWGVFVLILLLVLIPDISSASFINLEPSLKKVKVNETFNVSIYVEPSSSAVYTTQLVLDFPADLVSVESFEYDPNWMSVDQPGFDLVDNENGKLIKTLGYPSGFSEKMLLGALVLKSIKSGSIDLSINKESLVLDVDSNNTLSDSEPVSVKSRNSLKQILSNFWNRIF